MLIPRPKELAKSLVYSVTGGGAAFLAHKREYHRRRAEAERRVLAEAAARPELFTANRCPACAGGEVARRFTSPVGFSFAVCAADGCVYMDPAPSEATLARLYNDAAYAFNWLGDRGPGERPVEPTDYPDRDALLRLLGGPARGQLLDVGCADGGFMLSCAAVGFAVEGVDVNDAVAEAGRRAGLAITTGRLADVPGHARFDVITMLQLVEHIVEPERMLSEVHRLLRPGGLLYLNTPNIDSASFAYLGHRHIHVSSFGHVSLLSRRALEVLAERCGFAVTAHEYWSGRDVALHDVLTLAISPDRFRHRMALYQPRLYHACNLVDQLSLGLIEDLMVPAGHESYQRALLRRAA